MERVKTPDVYIYVNSMKTLIKLINAFKNICSCLGRELHTHWKSVKDSCKELKA